MCVLDVCSTLADQVVSQLLRAEHHFKAGRVADPWMLKLLVMAVYLIACSHVRISSCSASTQTLFGYQRALRVFSRERTKAQQRRDGAEGGAATRDGAKQTARAQSCGKGPRRLGRPAWIPLISTVGRTMETGEASVFTRAYEELYTSRALYHRLSSCSFPTPAKRPSHLWPGRTWHPAFYSTTLAGTRGHSGAESQRARGKESLF